MLFRSADGAIERGEAGTRRVAERVTGKAGVRRGGGREAIRLRPREGWQQKGCESKSESIHDGNLQREA